MKTKDVQIGSLYEIRDPNQKYHGRPIFGVVVRAGLEERGSSMWSSTPHRFVRPPKGRKADRGGFFELAIFDPRKHTSPSDAIDAATDQCKEHQTAHRQRLIDRGEDPNQPASCYGNGFSYCRSRQLHEIGSTVEDMIAEFEEVERAKREYDERARAERFVNELNSRLAIELIEEIAAKLDVEIPPHSIVPWDSGVRVRSEGVNAFHRILTAAKEAL